MLSSMLFVAFASLVVIYADYQMTKHNFGFTSNGVAAIPRVLDGEAKSPMQYRVLVPWLCLLFAGRKDSWRDQLNSYLKIKQAGIALSLSASWFYFTAVGVSPYIGVSILSMFFVLASLYDYADVYFEVFFLCVAFTALQYNAEWTYPTLVLVTALAALNKETGVIIPMVCLATGAIPMGLVLSLVFYLGYKVPRMLYGAKERYCEWFTLRRNIQAFKDTYVIPVVYNECAFFVVLVLAGSWLYATSYPWTPIEIVIGVVSVGLLIPSMWREIRVFAPTTLALIPMAVRGL